MQKPAYAAFREAVLDLSDEPSPINVQRYLAASRSLDRASKTAAKSSARTSRRRRATRRAPSPASSS
jgi:hypothetical protein